MAQKDAPVPKYIRFAFGGSAGSVPKLDSLLITTMLIDLKDGSDFVCPAAGSGEEQDAIEWSVSSFDNFNREIASYPNHN